MRILIIICVIITIIILIWIIGTLYSVRGLEEPKYSVVEQRDGYEIRQYESYLVAEVEVQGDQNKALNSGFRLLAGYIFGGNTKKESIAMTTPVADIQKSSEKIAMTVPVSDTLKDGDTHIVQFSLPSKYTLETLPIPNNNKVNLRKVEPYRAAVLRYTGWATEAKVQEKKKILQELLNRDEVTSNGNMNSAQYNPPLSFPFLRRNEIIIEIK